MAEGTGETTSGDEGFFSGLGYFHSAMEFAGIIDGGEQSEPGSILNKHLWRGATLGVVTTLAALKEMGIIDETFDKNTFDAAMTHIAEGQARIMHAGEEVKAPADAG